MGKINTPRNILNEVFLANHFHIAIWTYPTNFLFRFADFIIVALLQDAIPTFSIESPILLEFLNEL